jgi:ABC-type multidrug transport system fused ATPase/permease subunit
MKKTFTRIYKVIKPYLSREILGLLLTAVYTSAVFVAPIVSKYLIDEVLPSHSKDKLYDGLTIFFLICMLQPVAGYLKDVIFLNITENITYSIRRQLFQKIIQAPMRFFDLTPKGEIISRVLNDGRSSSEFVTHLFVVVAKNILLVVMILGGMFYLSFDITFSALLILVLFLFVNARLSRKFKELSAQAQQNYDAICTNINQTLDGIVTVKSFGIGDVVKSKFERALDNTLVCNRKIGFLGILINNLTSIITVFSICAIYGLGMLLVMSGKTTLGTVMALGLYFQMLIQPVYELQNNNIEYQKMLPILDRLYEYFEMEGERIAVPSGGPIGGEIVAEQVGFAYNRELEVLNGINLVIPKKGLISLVGRSGSGKSTFVKLLMGFYPPTTGKITIGGRNILDIGVGALRDNISFVPQEIDLFNCSVMENIICGKEEVTATDVVNICSKLNLHEKIRTLPEGYASILSERTNLSGGEKQRIGIARALIKNAPILIFDEPTAALDPENEEVVRKIMEEIAGERTVIVVAHKLSTIINSDKIIMFDNGKILDDNVSIALLERELCG